MPYAACLCACACVRTCVRACASCTCMGVWVGRWAQARVRRCVSACTHCFACFGALVHALVQSKKNAKKNACQTKTLASIGRRSRMAGRWSKGTLKKRALFLKRLRKERRFSEDPLSRKIPQFVSTLPPVKNVTFSLRQNSLQRILTHERQPEVVQK